MHAIELYTSTCKHVMLANPENPESLSELRRLLPCLRQALGCYVCFNVLDRPMGPNHNVCKHFVCQNCVGGKMRLKPSCSWCKDQWLFVPNPLLKVLVTCYKKLCYYIHLSHLGLVLCNSNANGETYNIKSIILEGINITERNDKPVGFTSESSLRCSTEILLSTNTYTTQNLSADNNVQLDTKSLDVFEDADTCTINKADGCSGKPEEKSETFLFLKKAQRQKSVKRSVKIMNKKSIRKTTGKKSKKGIVERKMKGSKTTRKLKLKGVPNLIDNLDDIVPVLTKQVKIQLDPPSLKPLSSCNCGKSGNFNQLTCIGQRCPCYSMKLPCLGTCKCKGCRNPKKEPDFKSSNTFSSAVLRSGTRTTTDTLVC
ncbi:E3 ubiquitin-protein ligase MSL2-like [Dreissena polymorpha]|uniref:Uncharacterized protein n=1 Tax=Dreissena polymorpha TaxID=45954 RepID=A0A9D4GGG4_DREPO|nr:E3 ubiquitin-protein ligase MSL2-like [Dreissena polymorpha]KAH3813557.1 hypothetical protein DPMN_142018 [Dreissena polymorpha]